MELKEINIKNFGKLSNFNLKLNENLNQIVEKNGFGKTTLMTFIKAMFYGFAKKVDRQKFAPWNKGTYGGFIIFSHNEQTYRLERTFGLRNALDETRLFNTQTMQELSIENIGEHFFGLDEATFTRLLYIDEDMLSAQTTSVLIGKLTKLTQNQQSVISSYDFAMDILDDKRAFLQKQNGKGAIPEKTNEILNLKRELENATKSLEFSEKYSQEIKELKENEIALKAKILELEKQIDIATKQEANTQNQKQLNFLLNEKQALENEQSKILALFPLGFPNQEALNSYANKLNELNSLNTLLKDQELQVQNQENQSFEDIENFNEKKSIALDLISSANQPQMQNKLPKLLISTLCISAISLIILILGLVLNTTIISIISSIILVFSILLSVIFFTKHTKTQPQNKILNQINDLFPNNNFITINQALDTINKIDFALTNQSQINAKVKDLKQNIARLQSELNAFNDNFKLSTIDNCTKTQNVLLNKSETYKDAYAHYHSDSETINNNSFQSALEEIKTHMLNFENIKQDICKIELQISNFENISHTQPQPNLNLNALKNERTLMQNKLDQTKNQILEKENKKIIEDNSADRIDQLTTSLNNAKNTLEELTHSLNIVKLTKDYLEQAKINLSSRYITPTQTKLNELAQSFPNTKPYLPLSLKDDLSIMFEEDNSLRNASSLSTGLNHTFALLTRIALINTIFENQKMPILLDDPFQALDENNIKSMQNLINNLSNSNQIIYLTCSN